MRRGKYEKVKTPVVNIAMCIALVLFSLVAVTVYMAQGLYARYVTRDTGSDSARVMKFGQLTLKENGDAGSVGEAFICIPGVDIDKNITVSFTSSEADVFIFSAVDTTDWDASSEYAFSKSVAGKPLVSWSVDSTNWTYLTAETVTRDKQTRRYHVYYRLLDTNTAMADIPLITDGIVKVQKATRAEYAALAGQTMRIDVTAYAVQANGFADESVAAAWNAVKN